MVQGSTGWVLTGTALSITSDDGQTWTAITPPGVRPSAITSLYFLDARHGWVVSRPSGSPGQLEISATTDGGTSWSTSAVGRPDPLLTAVSATHVDFIDGQHGWVAATIGSSAGGALPQGVLFRTADGGATWHKQRMPVGGPIEFVSPGTGWLADSQQGLTAPRFYVTSDGGRHWRPETVTPPAGFDRSQATYTIPAFTSPAGIILAGYLDHGRAAAGLYKTADGGATWHLAATVQASNPAAGDVSPSAAVAGPGRWLTVPLSGSSITDITKDGARRATISPVGLPGGTVTGASFTSAGTGWVTTAAGSCTGFKTGCTQTTTLSATRDGGAHWTRRTVP